MRQCRFFTADIRASCDQVYPLGLADMLQRDGYPAEPWKGLD